jgi:hypothetical protein
MRQCDSLTAPFKPIIIKLGLKLWVALEQDLGKTGQSPVFHQIQGSFSKN